MGEYGQDMVELLAGYANRHDPIVVVIGPREVICRVLHVTDELVTLAPIDGGRAYHAHPCAVLIREMEPIKPT
jgi:hypothetical protein